MKLSIGDKVYLKEDLKINGIIKKLNLNVKTAVIETSDETRDYLQNPEICSNILEFKFDRLSKPEKVLPLPTPAKKSDPNSPFPMVLAPAEKVRFKNHPSYCGEIIHKNKDGQVVVDLDYPHNFQTPFVLAKPEELVAMSSSDDSDELLRAFEEMIEGDLEIDDKEGDKIQKDDLVRIKDQSHFPDYLKKYIGKIGKVEEIIGPGFFAGDERYIVKFPEGAKINFTVEDLTKKLANPEEIKKICFHDWYISGYGPVSGQPWHNCKKCGINKEDI